MGPDGVGLRRLNKDFGYYSELTREPLQGF